MSGTLHCPFCGSELNDYPDKTTGARMAVCRNPKCKYDGWHFPIDITQRMIDGKKAQDALKGIEIRVAAIRSCVQDGYTQIGERNRNIFIALELFKDLIKEITSITKQEE